MMSGLHVETIYFWLDGNLTLSATKGPLGSKIPEAISELTGSSWHSWETAGLAFMVFNKSVLLAKWCGAKAANVAVSHDDNKTSVNITKLHDTIEATQLFHIHLDRR